MQKTLIIIDECAGILSNKQDSNSSTDAIPPLIQGILQGAKLGVYTIIITQHPGMLSKVCHSASTAIVFGLHNEAEYKILYPMLRLFEKEQQRELGTLQDREFIICRHETFPVPLKAVTLPLLLPEVSDFQVDIITEVALEELLKDVVAKTEEVDLDIDLAEKEVPQDKPEEKERAQQKERPYEAILRYMAGHPGCSLSEISGDLGVDPGRVSRDVAQAEQDGHVKKWSMKQRIGRPVIIPEITNEGQALLGVQVNYGKGGALHARWGFEVKANLDATLSPNSRYDFEYRLSELEADIAVFEGLEKSLCIQIEISPNYAHIIENIEKALKHFPKVISAFQDENLVAGVMEKIKDKFSKEELSRIHIVKLPEFLPERWQVYEY